jgi:NAD(P)-dependent dehydrogenase (short-subunit alcohol dehydrogenase family)
MKERLQANAVPIQIPIGAEANYVGLVDLVKMKAEIYVDEMGTTMDETEIPASLQEMAEESCVGRNGEPMDVARAMQYLAEADFVTGHVLNVDGGYVI